MLLKIADLSALLTQTRRLRKFSFTDYLCSYILKLLHNIRSWHYEELGGIFNFQLLAVTGHVISFSHGDLIFIGFIFVCWVAHYAFGKVQRSTCGMSDCWNQRHGKKFSKVSKNVHNRHARIIIYSLKSQFVENPCHFCCNVPVLYLSSILAFSEGLASHIWCWHFRFIQVLVIYQIRLDCRRGTVAQCTVKFCKMSVHCFYSINHHWFFSPYHFKIKPKYRFKYS